MFSKQRRQQEQGSLELDVRKKELDRLIEEERMRLRLNGEKKLSEKYLCLMEQRQRLDSSPRSVAISSPIKGMQSALFVAEEIKRRSPLDMKLNFLAHSPTKDPDSPVLKIRMKSRPVPIPGKQEVDGVQSVAPVKLAYGLSALRPSYIEYLDDPTANAFHTNGMA